MKSKKQFILLFYLIMAKTNTLRDLLFAVNHEWNEWKIKSNKKNVEEENRNKKEHVNDEYTIRKRIFSIG